MKKTSPKSVPAAYQLALFGQEVSHVKITPQNKLFRKTKTEPAKQGRFRKK